MSEANAVDDKLPVAAAAKEVGEPERSLFRAVEHGKVPSTTRDGVRVVSLTDVRLWAERRAVARSAAATPAPLPPQAAATGLPAPAAVMPAAHAPATVAARQAGSPAAPVLDGDQAAPLFEAFDRGESPSTLVQRLRISPAVAAAAWREYVALQGTAASRNPLADRIELVEAQLASMQEALQHVASAADLANLRQAVTAAFRGLPVPHSSEFTCASCGKTGLVAVPVVCTSCGAQTRWGLHPR